MSGDVINFNAEVNKRDLKAFANSLYKQVVALHIEVEQLREKLEHAEKLLESIEDFDL